MPPAQEQIGFFRTTTTGRHFHIAHLRPGGEGETSFDRGHKHLLVFEETVPEIIEQGQVVQEGQGEWLFEPAVDGHTHEGFIPVPEEIKQEKQSDEKIVAETISLFKEAKEIEKMSRDAAMESEEFYKGNQWDQEAKRFLESQQRSALTINEIQPKIDLLSGIQRQNRSDINYLPMEDGDQRVAEILNIVTKNILEQSNFEAEETEVFMDEAITGRGNFNIFIDTEKDITGEIRVEHFPWDDVFYGPHEKKDASDLEYMIKRKIFSEAKLKQIAPEKAEEIDQMFEVLESDPEVVKRLQRLVGRQFVLAPNKITVSGEPIIDIQRKQLMLLELWRKVFRNIPILINNQDGLLLNAENWTTADVNRAKTIDGIVMVEQKVHRMRISVVAGTIMIQDRVPDLAVQDFPIIPVYAQKRGNMYWGKVEPAKDMQREINKRHSQSVDIMNKVASYGWFVDENTFLKPHERRKFLKTSSAPGFVAEVSDVSRIPVKVEGTKFPGEIVNLEQLATQKMRDIMNIPADLSGIASRAESGIAIMAKQRQGLTGNEYLYDSLARAKKTIGRHLVKFIQELYSPDRILRLIENQAMKETISIGGQEIQGEMDDDTRIAILQLLNNTDLSRFDVVVSESASSPTMKERTFITYLELLRAGAPIPFDLVLEFSSLPEKEKVLQRIRQQQQAEAEAEQRKSDVEIEKTMIAAQAKQGGRMSQQPTNGEMLPQALPF